MAGDPLYEPLGQDPEPADRAPWAGKVLVIGLGACVVVGTAGSFLIGRQIQAAPPVIQVVAAPAEPSKPAPPVPPADVTASVAPRTTGPAILSAAEVDRQSGVRINRPPGAAASTATIIQVPQELSVSLHRSPDARLVEQTREGLLPGRGNDGSRPLDVYARPVVVDGSLPANAPRVALVVGGMGLDANLTSAAATTLPPAVTLAFAPYGNVLEAQVQSVREIGHEVVLQVPMESVGTASTAALSHILTAGQDGRETLDRLHWHMTRFTGYVGVANFLGATFTADAAALKPVLADIAGRGLLYFDDGTAARSQASALAPTMGLPMLRADVVVDASGDPASIDAALARLLARARERGSAVGFANGAPGAVDRIAAFARGLSAKGVALVPATALLSEASPQALSQP